MLLFDEMEKTFPYLEKVYRTQLEEKGDYLDYRMAYQEAVEIVLFITMERFLKEDGLLYRLFLQAGITEKRAMAYHVFKWMQLNMHFSKNAISRADTSPVQE